MFNLKQTENIAVDAMPENIEYFFQIFYFFNAINLCCYFHKLSSFGVIQATKNRVPAPGNNETRTTQKNSMIKTNN